MSSTSTDQSLWCLHDQIPKLDNLVRRTLGQGFGLFRKVTSNPLVFVIHRHNIIVQNLSDRPLSYVIIPSLVQELFQTLLRLSSVDSGFSYHLMLQENN